MDARKMLRLGIGLFCVALVLELLPSVTPSSWWLSTKWFGYTINVRTGLLEPIPYKASKGEPTSQELTKMARAYGIAPGDVNEMMSVMEYVAPGASNEFGRALWKDYPKLAARIGYFQVVNTRARVLRGIGFLIFLAGLASLFGALYRTYQAEKDIPDPHLRL